MSDDLILKTVQDDVYYRLLGEAYFADVPVLREDKGDVSRDVDTALNVLNSRGGKNGACATVLLPQLDVPDREVPGPQFDILLTVQVLENVIVNRGTGGTEKRADQIALNVLNILHHYIAQEFGNTLVADTRALEPVAREDGLVQIDCFFRSRAGLSRPTKVAMPVISGNAAAVTVACTTSGATIRYTTDGTYPGSANASALTYSSPFSVAAGTRVRAAAEKSNHQGSDVAAKTIS